ncbi:MAG: hypothetical protein ACRDIX_02560 [Actinomycetota bacterium]
MNPVDEVLYRVWQLSLGDPSDEVDEELEKLPPRLIEAGYVSESGHSPTGSFWAFTEAGSSERGNWAATHFLHDPPSVALEEAEQERLRYGR